MTWAEFKELVDGALSQQGLLGSREHVARIEADFPIEHCDDVVVKQIDEGLVIIGGTRAWDRENE